MKLNKKLMQFSLLFGLFIFILCPFLGSEKKGSIFGIIKSEKTNEIIPNVEIILTKQNKLGFKITAVTDSNGKYLFDSLGSDEYQLEIVPPARYCRTFEFIELNKNDNQEFDILLKSAGVLKGKIYKKKGKDLIPIPNAEIDVFCFPHFEEATSNRDGEYFFGRINPDCKNGYRLRVNSMIKNMAYQIKEGINIAEESEQTEDVIFNLDDKTVVVGHIKSSIDGNPIQNVHVLFTDHYYGGTVFAKAISDRNGYFKIQNLKERNYIVALNLIGHPQKKYDAGDIQKEFYVHEGVKQSFNAEIDVESYFY